MEFNQNSGYDDKMYCHWNTDLECQNNYCCGDCNHQPSDDDKPHGKDEPKELLW